MKRTIDKGEWEQKQIEIRERTKDNGKASKIHDVICAVVKVPIRKGEKQK